MINDIKIHKICKLVVLWIFEVSLAQVVFIWIIICIKWRRPIFNQIIRKSRNWLLFLIHTPHLLVNIFLLIQISVFVVGPHLFKQQLILVLQAGSVVKNFWNKCFYWLIWIVGRKWIGFASAMERHFLLVYFVNIAWVMHILARRVIHE